MRNNFLLRLKDDVKVINTKEVLVNGDKSTNIYKMNKDTYSKYLTENLTKIYKETNKNKINRINSEAKRIAQKLKLDDQIQQLQETETFISVKDHKEGFRNSPLFRLLYIEFFYLDFYLEFSIILDKINKSLLSNTKVSRWKSLQMP